MEGTKKRKRIKRTFEKVILRQNYHEQSDKLQKIQHIDQTV